MRLLTTILLVAASLTLTGCKTMEVITEAGTSVAAATGVISTDEAQSINRSASAVGKVFESITPEQEYYIGRTVAATILSQNKPMDDAKLTEYLNTLGQYLALCSDRPETFGGYHFMVMDSSDINAFAAPGGLILVSRGMIKCCRSENALAAVLAHEIAHVSLNHGLQAINKSRLTSAATILGTEAAKNLGSKEFSDLTKAFEDSISDITKTMVNNGYSRHLEFQADKTAISTLRRAGYNPTGLIAMLSEMDKNLKPGGLDFAKTHPAPKDRIAELTKPLANITPQPLPAAVNKRFAKATWDLQ
jgi:predicted Zn-dependent protease